MHAQRDAHTKSHTHTHHAEGQGYKKFSTVWHFHGLISPSVAANTAQWPSSSSYSLSMNGSEDVQPLLSIGFWHITTAAPQNPPEPQDKHQIKPTSSHTHTQPDRKQTPLPALCLHLYVMSTSDCCFHMHVHRIVWSRFNRGSRTMLHVLYSNRQPAHHCCCCLWRADGDFPFSLSPSFCCSNKRGQRVVIKLCLHAYPASLSLRLSSAGRFQQQGVPDSQTTSLLPSSAEAVSS